MEADSLGRSLVPSNERSVQLAQLSTLPDRQWVDQLSELYPDVVPAEALTTDLQSIDNLGQLIVRERRHKRGSIAQAVIMGTAIAAALLIENTGIIDPDIKRNIFTVGYPVFFLGTISCMLYSIVTDPRIRITNLVTNWNSRGQNWVQQQKGRLRINL